MKKKESNKNNEVPSPNRKLVDLRAEKHKENGQLR